MRIKRYHLACRSDLETLQTEVTKLLGEGWQPFGQIVVTPPSNESQERFLQTMVQYEGDLRS